MKKLQHYPLKTNVISELPTQYPVPKDTDTTKKPYNILLAVFAWHRDGALTAVVTDKKQQHRQWLGAASSLDFGYTKRHVHIRPNTFNSGKVKGIGWLFCLVVPRLLKKKRKRRRSSLSFDLSDNKMAGEEGRHRGCVSEPEFCSLSLNGSDHRWGK